MHLTQSINRLVPAPRLARRRVSRTVLEATLQVTVRATTRERLSNELGTLYTSSLSDAWRACAHRHRHEREQPQGLYQREFRELFEKLPCSNHPQEKR